jgi:hypothetical protein
LLAAQTLMPGSVSCTAVVLLKLIANGCLLPAALVALAAGLVLPASTALAAITAHARTAAPTSPAHLNLLVWTSVFVQQDMA